MRNILAVLVTLVGVACVVFGILFILEAGSSRDTIAAEIAPLQLSQVDAKYEEAKAALAAVAGTAQEQVVALQKTSLGLAKANIGTVNFVQNAGIVNLIIGSGFVFAGIGLFIRD